MEPKTNCGIAHISGILLMNSYNTDILKKRDLMEQKPIVELHTFQASYWWTVTMQIYFLPTTIICSLSTLNLLLSLGGTSTWHLHTNVSANNSKTMKHTGLRIMEYGLFINILHHFIFLASLNERFQTISYCVCDNENTLQVTLGIHVAFY